MTLAPLLLVELILVVVLPAVQTMRKRFQSYLGEVQDNLLMRLSWWDTHCGVHRGVSLQDFQLVGGGIQGEEWMVGLHVDAVCFSSSFS